MNAPPANAADPCRRAAAESPHPVSIPPASRFPWLPLAALATLWLPLLNHLRLEWSINEQYRFGFAVPLLSLYLFSLRWANRPEPAPDRGRRWPAGFAALLLLGLAPLLLAEAAHPDWRLLSWAFSGCVVGLTLLVLHHVGGVPWAAHFAFPVAFIFIAVPWPMHFETRLMQAMMQVNATAAAEILNLLAVPARQLGNVLDLGNATTVGVDEACSGVRSLQTSLMVALLFGELYRFGIGWRIALVAGSAAVAYFWNLVRTLALVWLAARAGGPAMEAWHDHIGLAVLVCSLGSVFALASGVRRLAAPAVVRAEQPMAEAEHPSSPRAALGRPLPARWCAVTIGWVAVVFLSVEAWYRLGTVLRGRAFAWTVRWPAELRGLREVPIPNATQALMKFTRGTNCAWQDVSGRRWSAYYLEWAPGRSAQASAQVHRPDICLPAAGKTLVADRGTRVFSAGGFSLPFRHYVFEDAGVPLHVYFSISTTASGSQDVAPRLGLEWSERWAAIRECRRNEGQQQLEIGFWGIADPLQAEAEFAETLSRVVVARP